MASTIYTSFQGSCERLPLQSNDEPDLLQLEVETVPLQRQQPPLATLPRYYLWPAAVLKHMLWLLGYN